jgi:hypothetical protein
MKWGTGEVSPWCASFVRRKGGDKEALRYKICHWNNSNFCEENCEEFLIELDRMSRCLVDRILV